MSLMRATAESALMTAIVPSEISWDFISGALATNPAKASKVREMLEKLKQKMVNGVSDFDASVSNLMTHIFDVHTKDEDSFPVYLYGTSKRRREEDDRNAMASLHINEAARQRKMILVGSKMDSLPRPDARPRLDGATMGHRQQIVLRSYTTYDVVRNKYIIPAVYLDTHTRFMGRHSSRIEELAATDQPRVQLLSRRKEKVRAASESEDEDEIMNVV